MTYALLPLIAPLALIARRAPRDPHAGDCARAG